MNKDLIKQLPADEQPVAEKLSSVTEIMKLSQSFQWNLETQLMDAHKSKTERRRQNQLVRFLAPAGWTIAAVFGVLLLTWMLRSVLPNIQAATGATPTQEASFEAKVRAGRICRGPLALAYDFDVFLTNSDKTEFVSADAGKAIGELRSFTWSAHGGQLAIVGNTTGRGNIYLTSSTGHPLQPVLASSELGYLMGTSWSQDGKRLLTWSVQNNNVIYLLNANGTGFVERELPVQIFETPQFTPGQESITFYGADSSLGDGLFQAMLNSSRTTDGSGITMISDFVENEGSFAWSPDGLQRAYVEMDRSMGEARLVIEARTTGKKTILGKLSIPKGSGAALPDSTNLSWSSDGRSLVFDFGKGAYDRAVYLARADGTGLFKVVDSAYTPSISADGRCLAYISNKQVFLLDLMGVSSTSTATGIVLLADLPTGRSLSDYRLDKLRWQP